MFLSKCSRLLFHLSIFSNKQVLKGFVYSDDNKYFVPYLNL